VNVALYARVSTDSQDPEVQRERVKAGLDRARAKGVRLGRPAATATPDEAVDLRRAGRSLGQIARQLNCSRSTVRRRLQEAQRGA
jgi:DNA invertase Pin-like site-specific DNA recombinase